MQEKLLALRVDEAFIGDVDNWRRTQAAIPSRSDAIRQLVRHALAGTVRADIAPAVKPIRDELPLDRKMTGDERAATKRALRGDAWDAYMKKNGLNKAKMTRVQLRQAVADLGITVKF